MEKPSEEPVAGPSRPISSRNSPVRLKRKIINSNATKIARKTTRTKTRPSYAKYIRKLCRDMLPDFNISTTSVHTLDDMMHDVFEKLANEAGLLVQRTKKKTLSTNDLEAAVEFLIPGALGQHAVNEGKRVIRIYGANME